ncbi:hypothetical protein [Novosphingobium lentum]|uniref:hypothetical protein n=1 Tax=Novosphingobium lentum TaxID=145287 RepID=UPI00083463A6|nr:hypothetical protein [Novosphingobium lentum]
MSIRLPSALLKTLRARLCAVLMVATIAFHAGVPIERPMVVSEGSAFSASTADVAIAPARRMVADRAVVAPLRLPVALLATPAPLIVVDTAPPLALRNLRPAATGPPPIGSAFAVRPSPRAPPVA